MATPARMPPRMALTASGLVLLWLAMLLLGDGPVDSRILSAFYAGHIATLANVAWAVTFLGGGYFVTAVTALAAVILVLRKRAWAGLVLIVGTVIGRALVEFQKYEISRLRPDTNPHLVEVHSLSFPSAHSANAAMTYVTIALLFAPDGPERRLWVSVASALALLIGLSRIVLGVHWPSDVVGGWSFGLLWSLLLYAIAQARDVRR